MSNDEFITVRIPRSSWDQIVDDIENWCGDRKENIEILQDAYVVEDAEREAEDAYAEDAWLDDDGPGTWSYDNWDYQEG